VRLSEWVDLDLEEVTAILPKVDDHQADTLVGAILAAKRVYVLGLGRSGLILRMFAMRLMQLGLQAHVVGDPTAPAIGPGDLLVALSGSGRTETVLLLTGKAQGFGARVAAITAGAENPLARLADSVLIVPAGSVKTDLTVRTRLPLADALEQAMVVVLTCIGAMLAEELKADNAAMLQRHANLE
jgi:6-phospho-3-hexuloisomerase